MTVHIYKSEAASPKKRDPQKYKWYQLAKGKAKFDSAHDEFELELRRGEKFGLKFYRGSYFLVDEDDLSVQFKLSAEEGKKLIESSKPFSGKVAGKKVGGGNTEAKSDGKFSFSVNQKGGKFHTGSGYKTSQAAKKAASEFIGPKTKNATISTVKGKGKRATLTHVQSFKNGRWSNVTSKKEDGDTKLDLLEEQYAKINSQLDSIDPDSPSGSKKYNQLKSKLAKISEKIASESQKSEK